MTSHKPREVGIKATRNKQRKELFEYFSVRLVRILSRNPSFPFLHIGCTFWHTLSKDKHSNTHHLGPWRELLFTRNRTELGTRFMMNAIHSIVREERRKKQVIGESLIAFQFPLSIISFLHLDYLSYHLYPPFFLSFGHSSDSWWITFWNNDYEKRNRCRCSPLYLLTQ